MTDKTRSDELSRTRIDKMQTLLCAAFETDTVAITDKTWQHRRHEGAKDGRGHFDVTVVSKKFSGKPPLARHRMVYDALEELISSDIHALSIQALVPENGAS